MSNIEQIAPLEVFEDYAERNLITLRSHPLDEDLVVANYTPFTAFKNNWDMVTLASRGLIFNKSTGAIVARPFRKFFNYNDPRVSHIDTTGEIEVANKEDGSMGVLYTAPDGRPSISTRGSMNSIHAQHATELYREKYEGQWEPNPNYTFVFEIIFPEGRIVLDYFGLDDLILIGAVRKSDGVSANRQQLLDFGWKGLVAENFLYEKYEDVFKANQDSNKEGFIIHFVDSDDRVKLKFDEYLVIHRLVSDITERRVWEMMMEGLDLDEWLMVIPDEFTKETKEWRDSFESKVDQLVQEAHATYRLLVDAYGDDRREIAKELSAGSSKGIQSLVFDLLDGHNEARLRATALRFLRV